MTHFQGFVIALAAVSLMERLDVFAWWFAIPLLFVLGWDLARERDIQNGRWSKPLPRMSSKATPKGLSALPCGCGGQFVKATYGGVCNRCGASV